MFALIAAAALLTLDTPPAAPDDTQAAYQAAKAHAGRSPAEQIRLAYWCEAHGLTAERARHLALAVLADPTNAAARGLLGLVARQDKWMRPDAVADQVKTDPTIAATLAEYDQKRATTAYTADGQWRLAQWADEHGLPAQAKAHYTAVVRLDSTRDLAWKKLGYAKRDGRWGTEAEVAAQKADAEAQKLADLKWKPLLEKWKAQLTRPSQQAEAEANMAAVTHPRAVPSLGRVFGASDADGLHLVQVLGQIDAPAASRALAYLAAFGRTADIRRQSIETLRLRDAREYAKFLIDLIRDPIRYEVKPVGGPGSPGILFVEGQRTNLKRFYTPPAVLQPGDQLRWDLKRGMPVVDHFETTTTGFPNVTGHSSYAFSGIYSSNSDGDKFLQYPSSMMPPLVSSWGHKPMLSGPTPAANSAIQGMIGSVIPNGLSPAQAAQAKQVVTQAANDLATVQMNRGRYLSQVANMMMFSPYNNTNHITTFSAEQITREQARSALAAEGQLNADVAQLDTMNKVIREQSDQTIGILKQATGQNAGDNQQSWSRWWVDQLGYAQVAGQTQLNPTFVEQVPIGFQPQINPISTGTQVAMFQRMSCFAAGTMVQTLSGPQPIETLQVGDMVLTQSTATGALGYHPILVTHHNPPAATFRIKVADDTIVASQFHRFWVAQRGWVMARDLKAGDPVRTLGGVVPVESVHDGKVELVYNLDIADDASFFAGTSAALVHDNTLPDPRLVPFDLPSTGSKGVGVR